MEVVIGVLAVCAIAQAAFLWALWRTVTGQARKEKRETDYYE